MATVIELVTSSLEEVFTGKVKLRPDRFIEANQPAVCTLIMGSTLDECGLICHFWYLPKMRNGRLYEFPLAPKLMPGWRRPPNDTAKLGLLQAPGKHLLTYTEDYLVPIVYNQGSYFDLQCGLLSRVVYKRLAIISNNQPVTQSWYRNQIQPRNRTRH